MSSITQLPLTIGVMPRPCGLGLMIVLITVPLMVLFIFVQRYLVVGFGAGAVRG